MHNSEAESYIHQLLNVMTKLDADEQREDIESLLKQLHLDAQENKIPMLGFRRDVFLQLLPLTIAAARNESRGIESFKEARLHALKLTYLFGSFDRAIDYLRRYEKQSKLEKRKQKQLVHDACLFNLPLTDQWNIDLWRQIVINNAPSRENALILRILANADKIEKYVKQNRENIENDNRTLVVSDFEKKAAEDYAKMQVASQQGIEAYIEENLKKKHKLIPRDVESEFDIYLRGELKLPLEGKLTSELQQKLIDAKKNISPVYMAKKEEMKTRIVAKYRKELADEFASISINREKQDYIKQKIKDAEGMINAIVAELNEHILSPKTPINTLYKYAKAISYINASKNPKAAAIFFENQMPEENFDEYLHLKPADDPKLIPPIFIMGESIDSTYKGYYLKKLAPDDPRAAILGKYTSCCQSLGEAGMYAAIHGIQSPRGGFYTLCKMDASVPQSQDIIVAQCWVWRGDDDSLVFDSIESQVDFRSKNEPMIRDLFSQAAYQLVGDHNVPKVYVGLNGNTPNEMGLVLTKSYPADYGQYRDSTEQHLMAERGLVIPLAAHYKKLHPETKLSCPDLTNTKLSKEAAIRWLDYAYMAAFHLVYEQDHHFSSMTPMEIEKEKRILLLQKWRTLLSELSDDEIEKRFDLLMNWEKVSSNIFTNEIDLTNLVNLRKQGIQVSSIDLPVIHSRDLVGKFELVKLLVESGLSPNITNRKSLTLLLLAAEAHEWDMVLFLISKGANINATSLYGYYCIHHAAMAENWEMVEQLIALGADLDVIDPFRQTIFSLAIVQQKWETVGFLLTKVKMNTPSYSYDIYELIKLNKIDLARKMIDNGANLDGINVQKEPHESILGLCYRIGNFGLLEELIERGADCRAVINNVGDSLLHLVARDPAPNMGLLNCLFTKMSNIDTPNSNGRTPLQVAAENNNGVVIKALINHGASTKYLTFNEDIKDETKQLIQETKLSLVQSKSPFFATSDQARATPPAKPTTPRP